MILCGGSSGPPRLVPESKMREFHRPPKTIPRSIGHRAEWIAACKQGKPDDAKAGFAYSGPFTEALLVGNLAARLQTRIEWTAPPCRRSMRPRPMPSFTSSIAMDSASDFIPRPVRCTWIRSNSSRAWRRPEAVLPGRESRRLRNIGRGALGCGS